METATADIASKPLSPAARIAWTLLILATLFVCYFSHLGALGFIGPDEPRYAWIARDMAESSDWVTPRLYGKPWFEKPPLFYWAAGISFKLFGVSEAAARLPSAICALLATLAVAWLALRIYGPETARWLLLLLPTTVGMIGFSHAAATDMPFSAMLTIALVFAAVLLGIVPKSAQGLADESVTPATAADSETQRPESAGTAPAHPSSSFISLTSSISFTSFFFGFFLGLAALAKGPAAIVLSGGAVFFWAVFTRRWRDALRLLHPVAIAAFCLTVLPWYLLCAHRNPDFFRIFIIEHNFKRYLTPEFQHVQPFWYYVPVLLVAFLPWTGLVLWSSIEGVIKPGQGRSLQRATYFLICWAAFCFAFFSFSSSKLPGYILPAIPAICLMVTHELVDLAATWRKSFRLVLFSTALFFFALFAFIEWVTPHILRRHESFGIAAGLTLALIGACNLILGFLYPLREDSVDRRLLAITCVVPLLLAVSMADKLFSSYFRWDPSGRTISEELRLRGIPAAKIEAQNVGRGQRYSLSFYLHREVVEWDRDHPREGYLLSGVHHCGADVGSEFKCEEAPFDLDRTGFFLYRVEQRSPDTGSGSGQLQ